MPNNEKSEKQYEKLRNRLELLDSGMAVFVE